MLTDTLNPLGKWIKCEREGGGGISSEVGDPHKRGKKNLSRRIFGSLVLESVREEFLDHNGNIMRSLRREEDRWW